MVQCPISFLEVPYVADTVRNRPPACCASFSAFFARTWQHIFHLHSEISSDTVGKQYSAINVCYTAYNQPRYRPWSFFWVIDFLLMNQLRDRSQLLAARLSPYSPPSTGTSTNHQREYSGGSHDLMIKHGNAQPPVLIGCYLGHEKQGGAHLVHNYGWLGHLL